MKRQEAIDAMYAQVVATVDPDWPIQFPDTVNAELNGEPPSAGPWVRATIRHADAYQSSLTGPLEGKKRYQREGTLHVQIFTPTGDGLTAATEAAEKVAEGLEDFRHPVLWFRNVRIEDAVLDRAGLNQTKVLATFKYDTVR